MYIGRCTPSIASLVYTLGCTPSIASLVYPEVYIPSIASLVYPRVYYTHHATLVVYHRVYYAHQTSLGTPLRTVRTLRNMAHFSQRMEQRRCERVLNAIRLINVQK